MEDLSAYLTDRDIRICLDLYEHRVLTTVQLYELHFTSHSRARDRLHRLHKMGLLRRSRPRLRPGSHPHHYMLDSRGALVVASYRGIDPKELGFRPERSLAIVEGPRLLHLRETNGFFTRLAYASRVSDSGYVLAAWHGEAWCKARWNGLVTPDGLGRLDDPECSVAFFLELDRGTENHGRLQRKLERYRIVAGGAGVPQVLLFCFPSLGRETGARESLAGCGLVVATTTLDRHMTDPLGNVWRALDADRRVKLVELTRRRDRDE